MKKVKRIGLLFGVAAFTLSIVACQKDNQNSSDERSSKSSPTEITVKTPNRTGIYTAGGSVTLQVTVLPSTANQNYTLSIISGSDYAKLSNNVLTAVKNGVTVIKAVTQDGSHTDTCAVTIANQTTTTPVTTVTTTAEQADYYVSPDGSDSNTGTLALPFKSVEKAYSVASAGKLIYFRGGVYKPVNPSLAIPIYLAKGINGTASAMIRFWAYPGETPIIDLSSLSHTGETVWGIQFTGDYWHWKGFEITGFPKLTWQYVHQSIVVMNSNNCIFENLVIHDNYAMGFNLAKSSTGNLIKNCDAYNNSDPETTSDPNGNADGFHFSYLAASTVNTVKSCRSWYNSDDGYDCYGSDGKIIFDSCYAFYNGYLYNTFTAAGDGDGFKLGGSTGSYTDIRRTLTNCVAVKNAQIGFDQNDGIFATNLTNCINYYSGGHGIYLAKYSEANYIKNCISIYSGSGYNALLTSQSTIINCSWSGFSVTSANFASTDQSQLLLARNTDGSLPATQFLKLTSSSAYQW